MKYLKTMFHTHADQPHKINEAVRNQQFHESYAFVTDAGRLSQLAQKGHLGRIAFICELLHLVIMAYRPLQDAGCVPHTGQAA
jgi:hypothetical protein